MLKRLFASQEEEKQEEAKKQNTGIAMGALFVSAIAVLLVLAGLVINIMTEEKAYRARWQDYDDYGWS